MPQLSLRPQDVLVVAKLLAYGGKRPPMAQMAVDLGLSSSEIHASLKRLEQARLVTTEPVGGTRPLLQAVEEFLLHGVKYAFPAKRGEVTRGVPTSHAALPLSAHLTTNAELPPVWPHAEGVQGVALEPLYRTVPAAALRDNVLYELLALIDAMREGRARERKIAEEELRKRIRGLAHARP